MDETKKSEEQTEKVGVEPDASKASALYDRFVEKSQDIFERGQEKSLEAWEKAMDVAREQLEAAGEFGTEQGEIFKRYLDRDFEQTKEDMLEMGEEAKERLNPARLGAGALSSLAKLLGSFGSTMTELSKKAENALVYEAGEITMAGTLTCVKCGYKIQLKSTAVVPICPVCQCTKFRKGY